MDSGARRSKGVKGHASSGARHAFQDRLALLPTAEILATCGLETRHGRFQLKGIRTSDTAGRQSEVMVAIKGSPASLDWPSRPVVRIHSKCETSEVFGSRQCDCFEQLDKALMVIQERGGLVIYLDQEGRGNGLLAKLSIYERMEELGESSVAAAEALGFPDRRSYADAAAILLAFGISSIVLLTNNPQKVSGLQGYGIDVMREDLSITPNSHNLEYLRDKRRNGHLIRFPESDSEDLK